MNSVATSTNIVVSFIAIFIAFGLLFLYYKKKISILECVIFSFATQAYSISQIGPTITTFYIVQSVIAFFELWYLLKNRDNFKFKKIFLLLFLLPVFSYLFSFVDFYSNIGNHFYILGSPISLLLSGPFFYIKTFIPLFLVVSKLSREIQGIEFSYFFEILYKVAVFSSILGIFQYLVNFSTNNIDLKVILGLKAAFQSDNIEKIRISAFFPEPKHFSAFLAIVIPYTIYQKRYLFGLLFFIVGILTISQTFFVCLVCSIICFLGFKRVQSVKLIVIYSLATLFLITSLISLLKNDLINNIDKYQDTFIYSILLERAVDRYDLEDITQNNEFLGLPLQVDSELPIVNFLKENSYLLITGYGPGNGKFIPPNYFENKKMNYRYYQQLEANTPVHMNMRWIYVIAEFGVIFFCLFFLILTSIKFHDSFSMHYYAYFWLVFFFNEIDILLIIFYFMFSSYKKFTNNNLIME